MSWLLLLTQHYYYVITLVFPWSKFFIAKCYNCAIGTQLLACNHYCVLIITKEAHLHVTGCHLLIDWLWLHVHKATVPNIKTLFRSNRSVHKQTCSWKYTEALMCIRIRTIFWNRSFPSTMITKRCFKYSVIKMQFMQNNQSNLWHWIWQILIVDCIVKLCSITRSGNK